MTHYRQGGKLTHCGTEMLPLGNDIPFIVIKEIKFKEEEEVSGRKEKGVWVAYFAPNPYTSLPMILNATNRKRLFKLSGNENIDELKNFPVQLTKEKCKDATDGGETIGLRISKLPAKAPVAAPKKKPQVLDADFRYASAYRIRPSRTCIPATSSERVNSNTMPRVGSVTSRSRSNSLSSICGEYFSSLIFSTFG